jgi:hypothetical protein
MNMDAAVATEQQPAIDTSNMEKIVLEFGDDGRSIRKSFIGKWLVGDGEVEDGGISADDNRTDISWDGGVVYSVAQTAKGALVVFMEDSRRGNAMDIYEDFDAMKAAENSVPPNVIAETADALGVDYEIELDI